MAIQAHQQVKTTRRMKRKDGAATATLRTTSSHEYLTVEINNEIETTETVRYSKEIIPKEVEYN